MKKLIFTFIFFALAQPAVACFSDFNCSYGYQCVKAPYQSQGVCMQAVNIYKIPTYPAPDINSVMPNTNQSEGCNFDTDCPIGFKCNRYYKACVAQ